MKVYFEVIDIKDDFDPYLYLLGIDWAFDNNVLLNLKKHQIFVETDTMCIISPLDPNEGDMYNELVDEDAHSSVIENIYKILGHMEDYVNPTMDGELSCRRVNSYDINLDDAMERWKNNIYEFSTRRCAYYHRSA
jgi:hypothetical protein